jgi:hypothetical protein
MNTPTRWRGTYYEHTYQAPRYLLCVRLSGEYAHRRCRATYYEHAYQVPHYLL